MNASIVVQYKVIACSVLSNPSDAGATNFDSSSDERMSRAILSVVFPLITENHLGNKFHSPGTINQSHKLPHYTFLQFTQPRSTGHSCNFAKPRPAVYHGPYLNIFFRES